MEFYHTLGRNSLYKMVNFFKMKEREEDEEGKAKSPKKRYIDETKPVVNLIMI